MTPPAKRSTDECELLHAGRSLVDVALPVGELHVGVGMAATLGHGQDVIDAGTHRVRVAQAAVDLAPADPAAPLIPLEDAELVDRLVWDSERARPGAVCCRPQSFAARFATSAAA